LRKTLEIASRQFDAALASKDLVRARHVLQDLGLDLMELGRDDPLRRGAGGARGEARGARKDPRSKAGQETGAAT